MVVTISRAYGSAALDVGHETGSRLGYRVVAEELPQIAALRIGASEAEVVAVEGRRPPLMERIIGNLTAASPETTASVARGDDFEGQVRREIESAVREAAAPGDVVIVGRIANMVLQERTDLVRVFLHAPIDWRIGRVCASLGLSVDAARKKILEVDEARRRYAKVHYDMAWGEARYYDLTLDVSRVGIGGSSDLIALAVRRMDHP